MSRIWSDDRPRYQCLMCGRVLYATRDGYMPIHRTKGKRLRCDASGASVSFHKKVLGG